MPRYSVLSIGVGVALNCLLSAPLRAQEAATSHTQKSKFAQRWVYLSTNLQVDEQLAKAQEVMRRAKLAGYNGVLLADYKLNILHTVPQRYFKNLAAFRQTADELKLGVYPAVCPIGYSNGLLGHDPNLAEGVPVRDAVFTVRDGVASVEQNSSTQWRNADFEEARGDKLTNFSFQDAIGQGSFVDREIRHSGASSLRFQNIGAANSPSGNGRVMQTVSVDKWRQYHLSLWVKTEDFETPGSVKAVVLNEQGRALNFPQWDVKRTQDWTQYHVTFNSLDNDKVRVYCGVWGGRGGKLWLDGGQLQDAGMNNLLRRDGCPLVVKDEAGMQFEEGRDCEPIVDKRMGNVPWAGAYEHYHAPPTIKLTPNSRITEGKKLRVSFYHAVVIHGDQVSSCLSHPKTFAIMKRQIESIEKALHPAGWLMSHDELRVANWCESCQSRNMTPGQLLAENVKRCTQMIREVRPDAPIWVWSDMFDPHHNAVDNYYLVNGTLANSWEGLAPEVNIANWNFPKREASLNWFASRGHRQLIAGYYDANPEKVGQWNAAANGIANVDGIMYTTWQQRYGDLESFSRFAWGE